MTAVRLMIMALCLAALAAGASCGRKGDPKPPEVEVEQLEDDEDGASDY